MRTQLSKLAFAAGILLALAFTFSCSSDDSSSGNSEKNNHSSNSIAGTSSADGGHSSDGGDNHSSSSVEGISSASGGNSSAGNNSSSSSGTVTSSSSKNNSSSSVSGSSSSSSLGQSINPGKECDAIFNPDNKFCYDGVVYDKCGGSSYNPVTQGCLSNKVGEKCGTGLYLQATQGCCAVSNVIYTLATQSCCGRNAYTQATQFCYDEGIYNKCDGMVYNPTTHICQNGVATPAKCNGESYNLVTQGCCNNSTIYALTQYCSNGTVKDYDSVTDIRDSKKYKTVVIGTQTWMAENLNYAADNSKCYYDEPAYCEKYGRLYDWNTAMAACPSGWRLPSNADWNVLMKFVNPSCADNSSCAGAGTKLKATIGWANSDNGTNDFGFSALPGGSGSDGYFSDVGDYGRWWSSTDYSDYAYSRGMSYSSVNVSSGDGGKSNLLSVRCVKD